MLAIRCAVQNASTDAQVLRGLSSFLDHLRSCNIDSILPQRFCGLSACNAEEIQAWSAKLEQGGKDIYSLTAAGRLWLEEVREAFAEAAHRLDEIAAAKQQLAPDVVRTPRSEAGTHAVPRRLAPCLIRRNGPVATNITLDRGNLVNPEYRTNDVDVRDDGGCLKQNAVVIKMWR